MGEPGYAPASKARYDSAAVILPSLVTPILTLTWGAGGWAGGFQHLGPAHVHLHGRAGLSGEYGGGGLKIAGELSAESAAYLKGDDFYLGDGDSEDGGGGVADAEGVPGWSTRWLPCRRSSSRRWRSEARCSPGGRTWFGIRASITRSAWSKPAAMSPRAKLLVAGDVCAGGRVVARGWRWSCGRGGWGRRGRARLRRRSRAGAARIRLQ